MVNIIRTEIVDAAWAYGLKAMALAFSSGDIAFFSTSGKLRSPLFTISAGLDLIKEIYWMKHEGIAPLLVCLTQSGRVTGYLIEKPITKISIGFANGCSSIFAGELHSTYNEDTNGQSKNLGKMICFRVLAGITNSSTFSLCNLDKTSFEIQKALPIDKFTSTTPLPCKLSWTIPRDVHCVTLTPSNNSLPIQLFTKMKDSIKQITLSEDPLLSVHSFTYSFSTCKHIINQ